MFVLLVLCPRLPFFFFRTDEWSPYETTCHGTIWNLVPHTHIHSSTQSRTWKSYVNPTCAKYSKITNPVGTSPRFFRTRFKHPSHLFRSPNLHIWCIMGWSSAPWVRGHESFPCYIYMKNRNVSQHPPKEVFFHFWNTHPVELQKCATSLKL